MKMLYGYRFSPTDEELVLSYLQKKVKGEPLSSQAVIDCEIYGDNDKEPWKIFGLNSSKRFYVFTKLKKKGKGKRIGRTAGCGTWKGQRTDPVKDSHNNHVGFKKLFVFEVKGSGSNKADKGHWLMHEYSLLDNESDYVLCEIRNKHATDHIVDDQPQQKRVRFSNSIEEEQTSFVGAATPVSTLASDEILDYAAASNSITETAKPIPTLAAEALGFYSASSSFIDTATTASILASDEELSFVAALESFIEETPAPTLASDEELNFAAALESFIEETPAPTLASEEELNFAAALESFIESTSVPILASDEAILSFSTDSNSFISAATTVSALALDEVLDHSAASNCENGLKAKDFEEELMPKEFGRDILGQKSSGHQCSRFSKTKYATARCGET